MDLGHFMGGGGGRRLIEVKTIEEPAAGLWLLVEVAVDRWPLNEFDYTYGCQN